MSPARRQHEPRRSEVLEDAEIIGFRWRPRNPAEAGCSLCTYPHPSLRDTFPRGEKEERLAATHLPLPT